MRKLLNPLGKAVLALGCVLAAGAPAAAQLFVTTPDFKPGPIDGSDPLVGLPIPGATASEYRAHLLWNMRAGLNVAALQCQFSPYLRAVSNYNSLLAHHSQELAGAYTTLTGYFKRVHGAREGQRKFDDYTTSTYNNFSTLHAQYGFCQVAADVAKDALTQSKGQLYVTAEARMRELRNSLIPAVDQITGYNPYAISMPTMPQLDEKCFDKKNRLKKGCSATYTTTVASR